MAQPSVRHQLLPNSSISASDLPAGLVQRRNPIRRSTRRPAATRSSGIPAAVAAALSIPALPRVTSSTIPTVAPPGPPVLLPGRPPVTSVRSRRAMITAALAGAIGLAASGPAASGPAVPRSPARAVPTDPHAATTPVAAVAAAVFSRSRPRPADLAFFPVTGADLAADALIRPIPPPAAVSDPARSAPGGAAHATIGQVPRTEIRGTTDDDATATAQKAPARKTRPPTPAAATGGSSAGVTALAFAKAAIGKPYRYGAAGPNAFDCSGLVMSAFKKAGVRLPRTSAAQSRVGTPVRRDRLQPGDLLFFYTPVSHVGIYLGGGKMVHASRSGQPVKISRIGGRPLHNARRI
jgi:peptidoglycan DL-endopeptidase CwlO